MPDNEKELLIKFATNLYWTIYNLFMLLSLISYKIIKGVMDLANYIGDANRKREEEEKKKAEAAKVVKSA